MNPAAVFEMGEASVPAAVAVCIATYQRPQFLGTLLRSLAAQDDASPTSRVLVVDNDPTESARVVVESFAATLPRLTYAVESERGIAAARNRLAALSSETEAEYVAFVDDDQWVIPSWLTNLVTTARSCDADVVAGPVVPEYEATVPAWIVASGFFDRPRRPTGTPITTAGTGNVLLRRAWLERAEGPFDRRFDLTGGSDTHLLERLRRLGARMVWCDEAVSYELVPASRGTSRWLLRRSYRGGLTYSLCVRALDPTPKARATRATRALARTGQSSVALLPSLFRGRAAILRAVCGCAVGIGGVSGALGLSTYQEYQRIHGR